MTKYYQKYIYKGTKSIFKKNQVNKKNVKKCVLTRCFLTKPRTRCTARFNAFKCVLTPKTRNNALKRRVFLIPGNLLLFEKIGETID